MSNQKFKIMSEENAKSIYQPELSMIKATELRIGNLLLFNGMHFEVDTIDAKYCTHPSELGRFFYEELEPIPLTEDLLLSLGLKLLDKSISDTYNPCSRMYYLDSFKHGDFFVEYYTRDNEFNFCLSTYDDGMRSYDTIVKVETVHHLQNVYFGLTNKELK